MAMVKQGVKHAEPLEGEGPDKPGEGENMAAVDDVRGVGPSPMPDPVSGHSGRLQSAAEAAAL